LTEGGTAVLRGNLAPAGAIIKPAAASPHLIQHRGRALVFDSIEDFNTRIRAVANALVTAASTTPADPDLVETSATCIRGWAPLRSTPRQSNSPGPNSLPLPA
jgi:hypothetical protein